MRAVWRQQPLGPAFRVREAGAHPSGLDDRAEQTPAFSTLTVSPTATATRCADASPRLLGVSAAPPAGQARRG